MNCRQDFFSYLSLYSPNEFQTETSLALQLRELIDDPETTVSEVVSLLSDTPAISRHILRIANNKTLGAPVDNLHDAIIKLGAQRLYEIVANLQTENMDRKQPSALSYKTYKRA